MFIYWTTTFVHVVLKGVVPPSFNMLPHVHHKINHGLFFLLFDTGRVSTRDLLQWYHVEIDWLFGKRSILYLFIEILHFPWN